MKLAPNPRRVRVYLAEKGIEVPFVEVDITKGENRAPAYLKVNPRGTLPALELDDGTIIDESIAICRYFEALHPEPPLFGDSPLQQARIEQWQRRVELDGFFTVGGVFRNTAPNFADRATPGSAPNSRQLPEMAERCMALLPRFMKLVDGQLANQEFIAGDAYSVADITLLCTIDFAKWIKVGIPDDAPHLQRWYDSVSARPSAAA